MIPKVFFRAQYRFFFQSIEKMFRDRAQKRTLEIMAKVIFKIKIKNYFGHDPEKSICARSRNILIEKMFGDCARKRDHAQSHF